MAPDKIYLGIGPMSGDEPNKRYLYPEWYEEPKRPLVQNVEYIRKDVLLEWLENKVELSYGVAADVLVEVFEKINSM